MISNRMTTNVHGDQVLTITVVGCHDIYRLIHALEHAQVEFAREGRNIRGKLRRHLGKLRYRSLQNYYNGSTWKKGAA